jgi:hypothetical protein
MTAATCTGGRWVAWGIGRETSVPDRVARDELADHIAALCLALHGRTVGDCRRCAQVLGGAG